MYTYICVYIYTCGHTTWTHTLLLNTLQTKLIYIYAYINKYRHAHVTCMEMDTYEGKHGLQVQNKYII